MAVAITQTANPAGVAASSTVATYTDLAIGDAAADRIVVVAAGSELAGANPTSCTIDGNAMSVATLGDFGALQTNIFYLAWPTGTTATIAVDYGLVSPGDTANHIAVYKVTGASATLADEGGDGTTDAQDDLLTAGATIPANGGMIAVAAFSGDTTARTWSNLTGDIDDDVGTFRFTTATSTTAGTETRTVSGNNNEDGALSYVTFDVAPVTPTFTQAEAAFYEDGTESGSTVIDAGADSITRTVDSDSNILLRVRLQETAGGAGASTDDYQLEYELNDSTTWVTVTTSSTAVKGFASTDLTDGGATTNRLGSGSGSFVAGEVSEDGLVDDLQITASNYTELLYSLTLVSADLDDADTLDFRVLRNSATTGMTYTIVPRITIEQANDLIETLTDNFDDNSIDTAKWTNNGGGQIVEQNQQLELSSIATAAYYNITSTNRYDLTASYAMVEIIDQGDGSQLSFEFYPFQLNADANNGIFWLITGDVLSAYDKITGTPTLLASVGFNISTHRYLRIREAGGNTFWDYSSNGSSWSNLTNKATPIAIDDLEVLIMAGTYDDEGSTNTAILDNFNVSPVTTAVKDIIGSGIIPFAR